QSIAVTMMPNTVTYTEGETLDLTGMVVTATYSDGTSKPVTGYTTDPVDGDTLSVVGTQTVEVSYTEGNITKDASFNVTVKAVPPPVVLQSIAVIKMPDTVTYTEGETLDLTGMVVTAYYSDGTSKAVTGYTTAPAYGDTLATVGTQKIDVSYTEGNITKDTSFNVTVNAVPPPIAPMITGPTTMTLTEGYAASSTTAYTVTGTEPVTVNLSSAYNEITWNDTDKTIEIAAGLAVGDYTVTLTASNVVPPDATLTFTLTVEAATAVPATLTSISVTTKPGTVTYTVRETLNLTGMVVTATYSDGTSKPVTGYTTVPVHGDTLTAVGSQTINVSYTEGNITQETSFDVTVNSKGSGSNGGKLDTKPPVEEIEDDETPIVGFNTDHIKYLSGYPDGSVGADKPITRAEMCAILFRLWVAEDKNSTLAPRFTDVLQNAWYYQAVTYMASIGIIRGYPDGTFKPDAAITRAEFAALISRFEDLSNSGSSGFGDIAGHWAADDILSVASAGWMVGYPDGTFKPQNLLTRAEAVTIINRMLDRRIDIDDLPDWVVSYNDLTTSHWAYADIMEASKGHLYDRKDDSGEIWTDKLPD
ncbi:MAG: S-layer homology domain-containing protein, partial [Oscillospiraceae bacterium]|nr:S-layer homology domain-containing protein [Oscillospiraceae bacterium]